MAPLTVLSVNTLLHVQDEIELLRMFVVCSCAIALIVAGTCFPF